MNQAAFGISISESISLLSEVNLFKAKGIKPTGIHSEEFIQATRSNRHTELHKIATKNHDYEILLKDDSIFQFTWNENKLRYAFIQNPTTYVSKDEFLAKIYTPEDLLQLSDEDYIDLIENINDWEYEQFFIEQSLNLESNIIRYDLDSKGYLPLIHPYSHLHIGVNQNLRIPCSKILTPLKFVIFAIKNTYYDQWKDAFRTENFSQKVRDSKATCINVPPQYWQAEERFELFLG
jgi:hypothetical protein